MTDSKGSTKTQTPVEYLGKISYYDEDGHYHREDGPASVIPYGTQFYWIHGKMHREDGPAVIHPDGNVSYYLHDIEYTEAEFKLKQFFKL